MKSLAPRHLLLAASLLVAASSAHAASGTWDNGAATQNWQDTTNWSGDLLAGVNTDTYAILDDATFSTTGSGLINLGDRINIRNINFGVLTGDAAAFIIGDANDTLNLTTAGIALMGTGVTTTQQIGSAGTTIKLSSSTNSTYAFTNNSTTLAAKLDIAGNITTAAASGTSILTLGGTNGGTVSGTITNGGGTALTALTKSGAGTWTLSGANTYTGTTTISGGKLALVGGNDRLATSGSVNFSAAGTLDVGSTSQTLANLTFTANTSVTGTVNGSGGTLTLTGSSFTLGSGGSGLTQTLNLSGLTTFNYNNAAGTFRVAGTNNATNGSAGVLTLGGTNTITASTFVLGDTAATVLNNGSPDVGTVNLGVTNTINANTITVGSGSRSAGNVLSQAGTTSLTLRGSDTTSRVTAMLVGNSSGPNFSSGQQGTVNLTNAGAATSLDAMITTLTIGRNDRGGSAGGNAIINTGTFTMGAGTLDATTIILGQVLGNFNTGGTTSSTTGTLNVTGGTVKVNNLYFADQQGTAATSSLVGILNLNSGANLYAANIAKGTGVGTGGTTRTFTWNDGTIHNYDASTDLTIASGLTAFNVTGAGTHAFNIDSGRTGTVNQAMSGAGALTKLGAGALVLKGANTSFSGGITVNAGSLVTGHVSALGSGSVNVTVGTLQVGDGSANTVTLGAGANLVIADGATLKLGGQNAASLSNTGTASLTGVIALNGGSYNFGATGLGLLDLGGVLNNLSAGDYKYTLISGALSGNDLQLANILGSGYDSSVTNLSYASGVLSFTAVPEPSTYGLIGAGALAAVAFVRRRRKLAGKVA